MASAVTCLRVDAGHWLMTSRRYLRKRMSDSASESGWDGTSISIAYRPGPARWLIIFRVTVPIRITSPWRPGGKAPLHEAGLTNLGANQMVELELEVEPKILKPPVTATPWAMDHLPPFPVVATRLMQALSKKDVDITDVGRVISAEPVFATRVLQMANSPVFALRRQVKTIAHAIILLGLERVKAITMTRAVGDFVGPALKIESLRKCWQNSLAGAMLSEKLARSCQMDSDVAYLAGLLRDIGRLALLVKYPGPYDNLLIVSSEHSFDLIQAEFDLFDVDHCQAGSWLMERMQFPAELCDVVAHHHDAPSGNFRLVHLVRIADRMANALGFAVVTPDPLLAGSGPTWDEVLNDLPPQSRGRFRDDPAELKTDILARIKSWN
jgi:HD-like signal output (HDOD) protein